MWYYAYSMLCVCVRTAHSIFAYKYVHFVVRAVSLVQPTPRSIFAFDLRLVFCMIYENPYVFHLISCYFTYRSFYPYYIRTATCIIVVCLYIVVYSTSFFSSALDLVSQLNSNLLITVYSLLSTL